VAELGAGTADGGLGMRHGDPPLPGGWLKGSL
jgi:hypothetical protein